MKVTVEDYLKPLPKSKEQLIKELLELEKENFRIQAENAWLDKMIKSLQIAELQRKQDVSERGDDKRSIHIRVEGRNYADSKD